jgi:hypothetical protein
MFELSKIKDAYIESQRDQSIKQLNDLEVDQFVIDETHKELDMLKLFLEQLFINRFKELVFMVEDQHSAKKYEKFLKAEVQYIIENSVLKQELTNFKTLSVW